MDCTHDGPIINHDACHSVEVQYNDATHVSNSNGSDCRSLPSPLNEYSSDHAGSSNAALDQRKK
jgi:hypothetical protein